MEKNLYFECRGFMLTTFLIVLALVAIFGSGKISDACAITLLLKILPAIILFGIILFIVIIR